MVWELVKLRISQFSSFLPLEGLTVHQIQLPINLLPVFTCVILNMQWLGLHLLCKFSRKTHGMVTKGSKGEKLITPGLTREKRDSAVESQHQLLSGTRGAAAIPNVHTPLEAQCLPFLKEAAINKLVSKDGKGRLVCSSDCLFLRSFSTTASHNFPLVLLMLSILRC